MLCMYVRYVSMDYAEASSEARVEDVRKRETKYTMVRFKYFKLS